MEDSRIKKEQAKLSKIFGNIPENQKKLCEKLIQNAAFMAITLEDLQEEIVKNGPIITQVNGNGFTTSQESPASKSYSTLINRYSSVIKQLVDLLPDSKTDSISKAGESLAAFVAKGKNFELR